MLTRLIVWQTLMVPQTTCNLKYGAESEALKVSSNLPLLPKESQMTPLMEDRVTQPKKEFQT